MAYNPNSIWGGKEKKAVTPPADVPAAKTSRPIFARPKRPVVGAEVEPLSLSFFRRHGLIFFTIGIFVLIGLAGGVYYLLLPPSTPNVVIAFSDPGTVVIGQPFPLTVTVSNESKSILENAELSIALPAGIVLVGNDPTQPQAVVADPIGTLSSESINPPETIMLVAIANPGTSNLAGTVQTIGAQVTYGTASTRAAQFQNNASAPITIGTQSVLSLSYNTPSNIFSGQNFTIVVNYVNNTTGTLDGVQLAMQFPPAYHFVMSSTTAPTNSADDVWDLGTLAPGAQGTLDITGNIVGPSQAHYSLTGTIGATFSGENYPAVTAIANAVVTQLPLSLSLTLNNSQTYVAGLSDTLSYILTYTNNSKVTFESLNITAALAGSMYNFSSLKTSGSFNSQSNLITWYTANTPALTSLAPGQSGTVNFTISTNSTFPIQSSTDKDYALSVTARATSPTIPPDTAGTSTASMTSLTSKVGGEIVLTSQGFHKETTTSIKNTGPYPPTVNKLTQYTIHWNIVNYSTDMQNVTVSAYLQSGSTFTGMATSTGLTSTTLPVYNAGTGEITWTIPYIPATTGVISRPVLAVFQITNTPAVNQVGQEVTLLGPATITATDLYTGSTVSATTPPVTTPLTSDPSVRVEQGVVVQ